MLSVSDLFEVFVSGSEGCSCRRRRDKAFLKVLKKLLEASLRPRKRKFNVGRHAAMMARPDSMIDQKRKRVTVTLHEMSIRSARLAGERTRSILSWIEAGYKPRQIHFSIHNRKEDPQVLTVMNIAIRTIEAATALQYTGSLMIRVAAERYSYIAPSIKTPITASLRLVEACKWATSTISPIGSSHRKSNTYYRNGQANYEKIRNEVRDSIGHLSLS